MVCRITLNLRTTVYGPTAFERTTTNNSFPLTDLRNPRSGPSDQTVDTTTTTKDLKVHARRDYNQSKDYDHFIGFTTGDTSGAAHQKAEQEV